MTAALADGIGRPATARGASALLPWLVFLGVAYNALLAALDANGVAQTYASVASAELAVLGLTAARVFTLPCAATDARPMALLYAGLLLALYVSLGNERLSIETVRNFAVIAVFAMAGSRMTGRQIVGLFRYLSLLVLGVLLLEIYWTKIYVQVFQPALYFFHTRGIPLASFDSSGLFRNALGFKGRFSFGLATHRTSSIFLEQVSLANYAGVVCVFLVARFSALTLRDRTLHLLLVGLILLTNDSRTSSIFALVCLGGYVVFPRLVRGSSWALMPAVLTAGAALVAVFGVSAGDDLRGRVSLTVEHLLAFDAATMLGLNADAIPAQLDSGYCFLIASSSVVGLVVFWAFSSAAIPEASPSQRRCLLALNTYLFLNLMIGGTAIFSIKVAAPLWALVGFMRAMPSPGPARPHHPAVRTIRAA